MKKLIAGFSFLIVAVSLKAQVLKPVQIDSLVTVSLPAEFQKRDTLGQAIYTGTSSLGYVVVIKAPNPPGKVLKKEKDLKKVFKEYIKKVQNSVGNQQSNIINNHDTIINNVEVRDFTLSTSSDEQGGQIRRFRILYTKPATYTFEFVYPEARQELAIKEADEFFASIKTAPTFDGTDQFTYFGQFTGMHKALKIALIAGGVLIIIIVIVLLRKRKRTDE